MKIERAILITFLGNYLINNVVAAIAAFVPAGGGSQWTSPQYYAFIVLALVLVAILVWWYAKAASSMSFMAGMWFGVIGFLVSIATAFITGVTGVLVQTASFSTLWGVLPNFGPFLWNWQTLVLLGYWVIPAVLVGWSMSRGSSGMDKSSAGSISMPQRPM